jgi:two-component system response regulator YesN
VSRYSFVLVDDEPEIRDAIPGYDDFEYARKALRLQVYDYIVKPITPGEFKTALIKLKQTLDAERENRRDLEHIKKQLAETIPLLRERFLAHLIEGKLDRNSIPEGFAYFDLPLPPEGSAYQCLVLDFIRRRKGEDFHIDLITGRNILDRFVGSFGPGIVFQDGADRLVILYCIGVGIYADANREPAGNIPVSGGFTFCRREAPGRISRPPC